MWEILPENDLGKIETFTSFEGLCVEHMYNFNV